VQGAGLHATGGKVATGRAALVLVRAEPILQTLHWAHSGTEMLPSAILAASLSSNCETRARR
jgi:hypothetical protein